MASVQELMKRYGGDTPDDNGASETTSQPTPSTASPASYENKPQDHETVTQPREEVRPAPEFDFSDDEDDTDSVADTASAGTELDLSLDDDDDDDFDLGSYYDDDAESDTTASNSEGRPLVSALAESEDEPEVPQPRESRHALDEEPAHTQEFDSVDETPAPASQDEDRPTLSSLVNRDKPAHTDVMPQPLQGNTTDTQHTTVHAAPAELDRSQVEEIVGDVLTTELPAPAKPRILLSCFALGLFFPLGAFSVASSFDTLRYAYMGEAEKSKSASGKALGFAIPAIVFGVVFWSIILAYVFMPDQFDRLYSKIGLG